MERIGFVGLGAMGTPMAWNIADAGFELCVHNRTAANMERFAEAGIATAESPAAAARDVDAVVTMVTGPDALREIVLGADGVVDGLPENAVVVNSSTVSRAGSPTSWRTCDHCWGRSGTCATSVISATGRR